MFERNFQVDSDYHPRCLQSHIVLCLGQSMESSIRRSKEIGVIAPAQTAQSLPNLSFADEKVILANGPGDHRGLIRR